MINENIKNRAAKVKLLLLDCDGVLTDGRLTLLPNGDEQKTFHVRDGQGIVLLHRAGLRSGIISGRNSSLVERRAKELGIKFVRQGVWNKLEEFEEILSEAEVTPEETAFVGDDLNDLSIMKSVGFAVAVADAVPELREIAHFITKLNGGLGAVREVTDLILQSQNHWQKMISSFEE